MNLEQQYPALATKIGAARQEGYGDTEIAQHIQGKVATAKSEGYSDQEVADYLGSGKAAVPKPRPGYLEQATSSFRSGVGDVARTVAGVLDLPRAAVNYLTPESAKPAIERFSPGALQPGGLPAALTRMAEAIEPDAPLPKAQGLTEHLVRGVPWAVGASPEFLVPGALGRNVATKLVPKALAAAAPKVAAAIPKVAGSLASFIAPAAVKGEPLLPAAELGGALGAVEAAAVPGWAKGLAMPLLGYLTAKAGGATDEAAVGAGGTFAILHFAPKVYGLLKTGRVREAAQVAQEEGGISHDDFMRIYSQASQPGGSAPVRNMAEANAAPAPKAPPPVPGGVRLPLEEYRRRAQAQIDAERPLPAPIQAMAKATNVPQPAPRPVAPDVAMGRAVGQSRRLAQETIDAGAVDAEKARLLAAMRPGTPSREPLTPDQLAELAGLRRAASEQPGQFEPIPPPKGFNPPLSEQARIPRAPAPRPEPSVVTPPVQNVTPVVQPPAAPVEAPATKPVAAEPWRMTRQEYLGGGEPVYKGIPINNWKTGKPLSEIDARKAGKRFAGYFSTSEDVARRFTAITKPGGSHIIEARIDLKAPLIVDAGGKPANNFMTDALNPEHNNRNIIDALDSGKYDGLIIKNTSDEGTIVAPLDSSAIRSEFGHKESIRQALAAGRPVPPEVLAEYPGLAPQTQPVSPKGKGGVTLGMGLGVLGEKPVEKMKEAGAGLVEAGKEAFKSTVLTPEREASLKELGGKLADTPERLRHGKLADVFYQMKNRFKTEAGRDLIKDVDDIQTKSTVAYGHDIDKLMQAGQGLTKEQRVVAGEMIRGKNASADPRIVRLVRAWREVYGRGPGSAFERARKLGVQVTEKTGAKRAIQFAANYMPRQLSHESKAAMGPDVAKFMAAVRKEAGTNWAESQRPGRGQDAWNAASKKVWQEWQKEGRKLNPTTQRAVQALMRSTSPSPWLAMQHLYAEIGYDLVGWHGSLERPRTAPPLPDDFYETDPMAVAKTDLWKRHQRLEQIERWGQTGEKLQAKLDAVAAQNPNEYRDAKDLVALSTGKYEQAHRLDPSLKNIADDFMSFEYGMKVGLGTATIENAFQAAISTALKHGLPSAARGQIEGALTESGKRFVARTGINTRSMVEMMTGKELGDRVLAKVADRLTRLNLFQGVNRLQNAGAAVSTMHFAEKVARVYRDGSVIPGRQRWARMSLEEMGINPKEIPANGKPTEAQLEEAAFRFARDSQLQKNILNEPKYANDPRFRWLYTLKRFGMRQFNWFKDEMVNETKKGNVMFPLRALAYGAAAGELAIQAKHLLSEFTHYVVTLGEDPVEWWKERQPEWWKRGLEDVAAIATLGWLSNMFRPNKKGEVTPSTVTGQVAWNATPVAASDIARGVEFGRRVGENPVSATKSFIKSQVPASRLVFEDKEDKKDKQGSPVLMPHKSHSGRAPRPRFGAGGD